MADEAYAGEDHGLKAKLADLTAGARDMAHSALNEAMAWSAYQWTVLALLTAIFILVALSYGGIRTELAALKQERAAPSESLAGIESKIGEQMSGLKSAVMEAITGLDDKITKIGAKLDARSAPKPAAPAPKPAAKPKPQ
jgi:hypothetical protein